MRFGGLVEKLDFNVTFFADFVFAALRCFLVASIGLLG